MIHQLVDVILVLVHLSKVIVELLDLILEALFWLHFLPLIHHNKVTFVLIFVIFDEAELIFIHQVHLPDKHVLDVEANGLLAFVDGILIQLCSYSVEVWHRLEDALDVHLGFDSLQFYYCHLRLHRKHTLVVLKVEVIVNLEGRLLPQL